MSSTIDDAREAMERAQELRLENAERAEESRGRFAGRVAVLVSILAAALALGEMQEKGAQNQFMSRHIQVSDDYAYYQAKTLRSTLLSLHAETLAALPNAADPRVQQLIAATRAQAARLEADSKGNGRTQLLDKASADEASREQALHRYERFETVVGALQIAIVLASVSIVTRVLALAVVAGLVGLAAIGAGLFVYAGLL